MIRGKLPKPRNEHKWCITNVALGFEFLNWFMCFLEFDRPIESDRKGSVVSNGRYDIG